MNSIEMVKTIFSLDNNDRCDVLDTFYNEDNKILRSTNYSKHFLGKTIPRLKKKFGLHNTNRRFLDSIKKVRTKVPKKYQLKITLLDKKENPCQSQGREKLKVNS